MNAKLTIDNWLTEQLGYAAYDLDGVPSIVKKSDFPNGKALVYAKLEASQNNSLRRLQALGFFVITVEIQLSCFDLAYRANVGAGRVRLATPADELAVRKIARESFVYDRFHSDNLIPSSVSDGIKENWVGNYFLGKRGDALFVVEGESEIAGFLLATRHNETSFIIDLIAVKKVAQGRGLGIGLVNYAHNYYSQSHQNIGVTVGTQLPNINSVKLYQSMGFRLFNARYVLHCHKE